MKVVSTVPKQRFERFNVEFDNEWDIQYVVAPYTADEIVRACEDADIVFIGSVHPFPGDVIQACKRLRLIHVEGVGFDRVDVKTAKELGIPVCNNQAVNNGAVAEHTIGLMLAGLRRTASCDRLIKHTGFLECQKAFMSQGQRELANQHVGLIGIGAIGREVAQRLGGWGCKISYYDVYRPSPEVEEKLRVEYLDFDELISVCDIISLHVPVLPQTYHLLSTEQFMKMKPNALVVNTARGEIIDQMALAEALESGRIYGAALDTVYPEPAPRYHPLLNLSEAASNRLTITPHVGGTTDEAFLRMLRNAIANMRRVVNGELPVNIVY